ncbi:MAG: SDR family NAD(P)-dependent oxidoreductase [Thiotrichaceae bacterium]
MFQTKNSTWVVGYGDIGRRLGKIYQKKGREITVTIRSNDAYHNARLAGHKPYRLELDNEIEPLTEVGNTNLFYFIPPPREGKQDTRIRKFLSNISIPPARIVLISTTGVYGHCHGQWVDESRPIKPLVDRAYRRADAEQQLMQWIKRNTCACVILRVPGIYAEDRLPLKRLEQGLAVLNKQASPWTNRIHADDLAMICYQAMQYLRNASFEPAAEIINVSDGNPSTMTAYFNAVADYANLPRPPQISLQQAKKELSKGMLSYMNESRRISNKKMLSKLGIKLRYPSLEDCLKKHT